MSQITQTPMTEQASPLIAFYKHGWEHYQQALVKTIESLSSEQLTIPITRLDDLS
jgi:hypothetical protein